jgi:guanylate kinase
VSSSHGLLVVVAGPSGVGKGSVHTRLRAALPDAWLSVSVTTRPPRAGERDGSDYRFVEVAAFEELVREGELLEWAEYAGHLYGTPFAPVSEAIAEGAVVLLDIEVKGALQVKQRVPGALLVFLAPPSFEELERRLRGRGTEDDASVRRRLEVARREVALQDRFDVVVVNDDLERCAAQVLEAVATARASARDA